jgi:hypothetical protein
MANYSNLINSIKAVIKQNGTNDITGQLMQDVLVAMTNSIGRFAAFAGTAMPSTNPNNPDQTVYYLTSIPGTYANFGGIVVPPDRLVALHNISGSWEMVVVVTFSDGGTISIDPALDPDSVNPVENRALYAAFQNILQNTRLYEHQITLNDQEPSTPTPHATYTILMLSNFSTAFISLDTLLTEVLDNGKRYPVVGCAVQDDLPFAAVSFAGEFVQHHINITTPPYTSTSSRPLLYTTFVSDYVRQIL